MKKTIVTFLTLLFVHQTYSQEIVEYIVESNRNGFDITYTNDGGNTWNLMACFRRFSFI